MKNRVLANVFAVITVVTCGIVITSVQSNAIAGTLTSAFGEAAKQPRPGAGAAALGYRHENRTFFRWYEPGVRRP